MASPENNYSDLLATITDFISSIGIPCKSAVLDYETFLPGADIKNGCILYDEQRLLSPGDLLHEAGHIAVLMPEERKTVSSPDVSGSLNAGAAEMAAIAWSWSALKHLQLAPEVVFHPKGYHDGSASIIENFSNERYFGVPILQWLGMTTDDKNQKAKHGIYPSLSNWLRPD